MTTVTDENFNAARSFLSLKWKSFIALSLVLILVNASLAYLVFLKTTGQFETEQNNRRLVQVRELNVVLSRGLESISAFASFIPLLSVHKNPDEPNKLAELMPAVVSEHGLMLAVEWGVEGIHYFGAGQPQASLVSWPEGRRLPSVAKSLTLVREDEMPRGQLDCDVNCFQVTTLPLLEHGRTAGYLVIERSVGDSLKEFHLLSGADIALLDTQGKEKVAGQREINPWSRGVPVVTHEKKVMPILQYLAQDVHLAEVLDGAKRIEFESEWYEVFAIPALSENSDLTLLMVNKVTTQVEAIREATKHSLVLGLGGLVLSELILLLLMWGPMERIQDVVYALPLLAEKSFSSLRAELPRLPPDGRPRDEIDLMVNVIRDVSEQIETLDAARTVAEHALRKSEHSLQMAQAMAKVVSWVGYPMEDGFSLGHGAGRIDGALERVQTWTDFLALVHPDDRSNLRIAWRRGREDSLMDVEFRLMIGGRCIDLHAMAEFSIVGTHRILRAVGMLQDVTDMRTVQRALRSHRDRLEEEVNERTAELVSARNRAERLAKNKSDFLANMSHEIRTPMNAVLGLSQMGIGQSQNRKIAATFEQILGAGEHLLRVVNDVLDVSKLEAGKLTIETAPFELRKVLRTSVQMISQRAQAKSLRVEVNVGEDLPEWAVGDGFRVQQILINLLGNATKFTEQGSIALTVYRKSEDYVFEVRDTGIGMSPDQLRGLFRPFHQIHNSLTRNHEGTGLGLVISNTLAELMGGAIDVRSTPGVGSEFSLRLPLQISQEVTEPRPEGAAIRPSNAQRLVGIRVLVADDVQINRTIAGALLEAEGALVTMAANGAEAVDAIFRQDRGPLDVVLMDLEMPEMDGRQATRTIRVSHPTLPIIGMTAHVSDEERDKSLASGMSDQLVKPVMPDELVAAILFFLTKDQPAASGEQIVC